MAASDVQPYLHRARDFFNGMRLVRDDLAEYRSSAALLGIHSAISYSDALRTGMGCADVSAEDHRQAASDLKTRLTSRKYEKTHGASHLEKLLAVKTWIAYSAEATNEAEIQEIVKHADRFASWAEDTGRRLRIEGW